MYDSVAGFNYGRQASLDIYKMVNVKPGQYTTTACHSMNICRKYNAFFKSLVHLHCGLVIIFICVLSHLN